MVWTCRRLAAVTLVSAAAVACEFEFSYDAIEAPLGTVGEIGIRVTKTHPRCVLSSMDEYDIAGESVQILDQTTWVEVAPNVFETWVTVSLSDVGAGVLRISKFCTKEGYEEALLPVQITTPIADGDWATAVSGLYPFDVAKDSVVETLTGTLTWDGSTLRLGDLVLAAPAYLGEEPIEAAVTLFVDVSSGEPAPLLAVGDSLFLRLAPSIGA